jgi:arsenite transporter
MRSLGAVFHDWKILALSLVQNWVVGSVLTFGLTLVFLRDHSSLYGGLILIGLGRCIARVVVWNDRACGGGDYCARLVAFNSLFQLRLYSVYAWIFVPIVCLFSRGQNRHPRHQPLMLPRMLG